MSDKSRDLNLKGIILKKIPYQETSLIMDVFTFELGTVSVMAKGVRKAKSKTTGMLEILNELDLVLYKNPSSDWYIFKNAELIKAHLYETDFRTGILMQGAAEIYKQLVLEHDDFADLYNLMHQYLLFIRTIPKNGIAIFWRFLLKLFRLIGIEFNVNHCVECGEENNFIAYYPQRHGFICNNCYRPVFENYIFRLNDEQADIFANLMQIGKLLDELKISKQTISQINHIFLMHLSEHFHQKFYLRSVEMY
jgi:DNA repair protein RecO (recombination protein O)